MLIKNNKKKKPITININKIHNILKLLIFMGGDTLKVHEVSLHFNPIGTH